VLLFLFFDAFFKSIFDLKKYHINVLLFNDFNILILKNKYENKLF